VRVSRFGRPGCPRGATSTAALHGARPAARRTVHKDRQSEAAPREEFSMTAERRRARQTTRRIGAWPALMKPATARLYLDALSAAKFDNLVVPFLDARIIRR
jgi:hypothetical protein